jgi:uncharacterized damage-inducible protein DinB
MAMAMELNPYAGALGGGDPVLVMAEMPKRWAEVVAGMSAAEIERAPAPGKWSVREVLVHLADCEIAFAFRLRQAYAGERMIQPFDQGAWGRAYGVYTAEQALAMYATLRAWNVSFVSGLTEADKQLPVMHPERGEMVLWTVVETIAGHDSHHFAKLEAR